jgi:hypothetical protein
MNEFQQYLEREMRDIAQEVPVDFMEQASKGLEVFFARFASAEHSALAISMFESSTGAGLEIDLGTPLQFLFTGTGEYGPKGSNFIVASPHNVLSWVQDGERRFASYVYNPGMPPKFSEEDIKDAAVNAIVSGDYA